MCGRYRHGLVWTYLGLREKQPPLPELEYLLVPQDQMFISKRLQECHWTQCMDGDMDATHVPFLHRAVLAALGPGSAPCWRPSARAAPPAASSGLAPCRRR